MNNTGACRRQMHPGAWRSEGGRPPVGAPVGRSQRACREGAEVRVQTDWLRVVAVAPLLQVPVRSVRVAPRGPRETGRVRGCEWGRARGDMGSASPRGTRLVTRGRGPARFSPDGSGAGGPFPPRREGPAGGVQPPLPRARPTRISQKKSKQGAHLGCILMNKNS